MPVLRAKRRTFAWVAVASTAVVVAYAAAPVPQTICATPLPGTTYTYSATANTASSGMTPPYGAIYDARTFPNNEMAIITGGQVNYVEEQFEDDFGSFNLTRWMPTGSYSDGTTKPSITTPFGAIAQGPSHDHCPAAGAVGAASPGTCTLLDPDMLTANVDLTAHGYVKDTAAVPADSGKGAIMRLSQEACYNAATGVNNPNCCSTSTLKNGQKVRWGARAPHTPSARRVFLTIFRLADPSLRLLGRHPHLFELWRAIRRAGCVIRAVVLRMSSDLLFFAETEAAFNLTVNGGAYVFFGSYMVCAVCFWSPVFFLHLPCIAVWWQGSDRRHRGRPVLVRSIARASRYAYSDIHWSAGTRSMSSSLTYVGIEMYE